MFSGAQRITSFRREGHRVGCAEALGTAGQVAPHAHQVLVLVLHAHDAHRLLGRRSTSTMSGFTFIRHEVCQ